LLPDGRPAEQTSRPSGTSRVVEPSFTRDEALHTSAFWVLLTGIAIGSLVNNGIPASLAPIFVDHGLSFEMAASALIWYGVASIVTKLFWGWIANRFAVRSVLLILTLYGTFALPSLVFFPSLVGPMSYGLLSGFYIGAYFFLSQMVWADYFGRSHVGAISALGRPAGLLIGATGPFLLAFTRDLTGSYDLGILLNALSAALCFGCLFLVRPIRRTAQATSFPLVSTPPASR